MMGWVLLAVEAAAAAAAVPKTEVFDETRTIAICVIGSVIGAFLAVAMFPVQMEDSNQNRARKLSMKFGSSLLGGVALSPALMEYIGIQKSADKLMGFSAITAVFVVSGLHILAPRIEKWIATIGSDRGKFE